MVESNKQINVADLYALLLKFSRTIHYEFVNKTQGVIFQTE